MESFTSIILGAIALVYLFGIAVLMCMTLTNKAMQRAAGPWLPLILATWPIGFTVYLVIPRLRSVIERFKRKG